MVKIVISRLCELATKGKSQSANGIMQHSNQQFGHRCTCTNLVKNCRQEEHHGARLRLEQCEHFQDERSAGRQDVQADGDLGEVEGAHDRLLERVN